MQPFGFHHVTAISARIRENRNFYTDVLGLRLVKRTVNQDDTSAYHLFYADGRGNPGTDLTFFDFDVPPARRGTRSIVRTGFRVTDADALHWWSARLRNRGVSDLRLEHRDGRAVLDFEDPEGQRLSLVEDRGEGPAFVPWESSPVPPEHQLRGLGPLTLSVPALDDTELFLTKVLGMERRRRYEVAQEEHAPVHVFGMAGEGAHSELHVAVEPHLPPARMGAGGVHHLALRTPSEEDHAAWVDRLRELGVPNSGRVDRYYFRSLYFRDPSGILFEIATDGPGFHVDEPVEALGENLVLPPFLEPRREEIEAELEPLD